MNESISGKISLTRPLVLIGMMGAGKTSVGQALADLLSAPFFDSDAEIEAAAGRSVAQIFESLGEAEFRRMEREVVVRLLEEGNCLLSLGGGAFMDDRTRERVKQKAFSVWLKVDRKILLERVLRQRTRPLLKSDPRENIERILSEREPVYSQADLVVSCDDGPVWRNARRVMDAIRAALASRTP